jgi:hypothetical protein
LGLSLQQESWRRIYWKAFEHVVTVFIVCDINVGLPTAVIVNRPHRDFNPMVFVVHFLLADS